MGSTPSVSPLAIVVCWDEGVATITATGELDLASAATLTRRLLAVAAEHPDRLVLDLGGVVFVDVAGARALDVAHARLLSQCPVVLRAPRPSARSRVSRLTDTG